MDVISKITAISPPASKKESQAFFGVVDFRRMHIPDYRLIVNPLYPVTQKKNHFIWGPVQQRAFKQIKEEIVHAEACGPVWTGQDAKKCTLHCSWGELSYLESLAESPREYSRLTPRVLELKIQRIWGLLFFN